MTIFLKINSRSLHIAEERSGASVAPRFGTITWQKHAWFRRKSGSTTWPLQDRVVSSRVVYSRISRSFEAAKYAGWRQIRRWRHLLYLSPPSFPFIWPSSPPPQPPPIGIAGEGQRQTLKEGATGPRRGTHIHAPGKHKHHAWSTAASASSSTVTGEVETMASSIPIRFRKRPTTSTGTNTKQDNRKHKLSPRTNERRAASYQRTENECAPIFPPLAHPLFLLSHSPTHSRIHTSSLAPALSLSFSHTLSLPPSHPLYPFSLVWSIVDGRDVVKRFGSCLGVLNGGRAVHVVDGDNLPAFSLVFSLFLRTLDRSAPRRVIHSLRSPDSGTP